MSKTKCSPGHWAGMGPCILSKDAVGGLSKYVNFQFVTSVTLFLDKVKK